MKRTLKILVVLVLMMGLISSMTGCQATKDVKTAEAFLKDYYKNLDKEDYDDVLSGMNDDLIEELGGEQMTEHTLILRRKLGGNIHDYEVENVSFNHSSGQTEVTFKVITSYNRETNLNESFTVFVDGEDVSIIGINLESMEVFDRLFADFVEAYAAQDITTVQGLFSPIYYAYGTKEDIANILTFASDTAGVYTGSELVDYSILMEDLDGSALVLAEIKARMTHEAMDMILRTQLCEQDGELGFSFIELLPAPCVDVSQAYYSAVVDKDIDAIMALYRQEIFDNVEGGADAWKEYLIGTHQEVGEYEGHEVYRWYMETVTMESGLSEDAVFVVNRVNYENMMVEETIGMTVGGNHDILYHSFMPIQE